MNRYLVPGDIKRNQYPIPIDGDLHLRSGRAFHKADHAVLRGLHSRNHLFIHLDDAVSLEQSCLLRRTSWYDTQNDGSVVGDIELDSYALEIACKLGL